MDKKAFIDEEFNRVVKNSYWANYYMNAPSLACKEYIKLGFCFNFGVTNRYKNIESLLNEISKDKDNLEDKLGLSDWEYLCANTPPNPFKGKCRAHIKTFGGTV